jgi:transketolase
MKATTAAASGHPSSCLSAADLVATVFFSQMRFDPADAAHPANDRFVLSKGHAAPLLWAALAEAGAIDPARLETLRRIDSDLEGHPTPRMPWVDVATGSLGQGLSAALGEALSARMDGLDFETYALLGDGECAEGSVWEAAELAAYYKVSSLYAIVDVNGLGQSQRTMDEFDADRYAERFRAFGWYALTVDGHDYTAILEAFDRCRREAGNRPRAIAARTVKGKGVPFMENREGWHGKPIPEADLEKALAGLAEPFAKDGFRPNPRPKPAASARPAGPSFQVARQAGEMSATREAYGDALAKLVASNPKIVALDGDTKNSTFADKALAARPEQFFEMFIAEQNMVGVAMGLAARGKIPFVSTFAAFLTRAYDQIRMAGVSGLRIKFCGSHCGVSIGEDGPSQMGLEDLAMFRPIPGCAVLYPSDAVSAEHLTAAAAEHPGMCYIRTTRPKTKLLYPNDEAFPIGGSKVLLQSDADRVAVVAAGITVHESLKAAEILKTEGIAVRIVDAYSVKPVDEAGLRAAAEATGGRMVVAEDHYAEGGLGDAVLGAVGNRARIVKVAVRETPRSGSPEALLDRYGISARHIADAVRRLAAGWKP